MSEMRDIPWYEWLYMACNEWIYSIRRKKLLSPAWDRYPHVVLCKNSNPETYLVHRIIGELFVDNPDNLPCLDHIDNDKWNYAINNLQWLTHKQNSQKAVDDWLYTWPWAKKIKVYQLTKDWTFIRKWNSLREASRWTWILVQNISQCCKWKIKTSWWFKRSYNYKFKF